MNRKHATVIAVVLALIALLAIPPIFLLITITGIVGGKMKEAGQAAQNPCNPVTAVDVADTSAASATAAGGTVLPVRGPWTYTSTFGMRMHPIRHVMRLHAGMDLATRPVGGAVLAARAGTVAQVKPNNSSAGNMLVLDHGGGLTTVYMHLASFTVKAQQKVTAGQQIAVEGNTGGSTGAHLHFEVRQGGTPTDPAAWLTLQGVAVPKPGGSGTSVGAPAAPSDPSTPLKLPTPTLPAAPAPTPAASGSAVAAPAAKPLVTGLPAQVGVYRGEQVLNAALIIQAGRQLRLDDHTITVGIMTAMGESALVNLAHGDKVGPDSRGLFQQRTSWGPLKDRMNPTTSATLFFTALMKVRGYASMPPTVAAHATQRNADPYHYVPYWAPAVNMMAALTNNAALETSLGGNDTSAGASAPCSSNAAGATGMPVGNLPPGPDGPCPAVNSPAERGLQPATLRMMRCGALKFPAVKTFYGVGGRPGPSEHPSGRAIDFMIEHHKTPQGRAYGWQLAKWMQAHADELGVKYVIFDVKIWNAKRANQGWRPYTRYGSHPDDTLGHRDHVHVSMR